MKIVRLVSKYISEILSRRTRAKTSFATPIWPATSKLINTDLRSYFVIYICCSLTRI